MPKRQLLSVVVPVYNESGNILPLYNAINNAFTGLPYSFEIIYVNDGSKDDTSTQLNKLAAKHPEVKPLELVRNFGKEIAISAGLFVTRGEAAIMLDADLQHPPSLIPEFIKRWQAGADVVVGVRNTIEARWHKRAASSAFYRIINTISTDSGIIPHETDFRLVDRQVIDAFNSFTERNRITRGLFNWLGFNTDTVYFEAPARTIGEASYSFKKRIKLALDSFVGHSVFLLRLAGYLGIVITVVSGLLGVFIFFERYVFKDPYNFNFSGPAILAVIILFLIGIVLTCLGFMSLYIAQIHQEVVNRPLYVIRRNRNESIK